MKIERCLRCFVCCIGLLSTTTIAAETPTQAVNTPNTKDVAAIREDGMQSLTLASMLRTALQSNQQQSIVQKVQYDQPYCGIGCIAYCVRYGYTWRNVLPGGRPFRVCVQWKCECRENNGWRGNGRRYQ